MMMMKIRLFPNDVNKNEYIYVMLCFYCVTSIILSCACKYWYWMFVFISVSL